MKKNWICIILFFSMVSFAQQTDSVALASLVKMMDAEIPIRLKEKKVPGIAVAIIDEGSVVYKRGIGFSNLDKQLKVTSEMGFNIGSVSKMFTAWGVMKLVEQGKVQLDTAVHTYLTRWQFPDSEFDCQKVTIRSLLSHTAGLSVRGYPGFQPDEALPTLAASLAGENGSARANEPVTIVIPPQTRFKYSGGGYTILQLLIEEVSGKHFADYMQQKVFSPLGMKNTSFTIDDTIMAHSATPYDEEGIEINMERFTAQAAAGLHTTLEDLLAFAQATLRGNSVLKESNLKAMRTPNELTKGRYGLGYMIFPFGKMTVTGHAGSNDGWESCFLIDFEHKSGMIMLSNGSQGKAVLMATMKKWVQWKSQTLISE